MTQEDHASSGVSEEKPIVLTEAVEVPDDEVAAFEEETKGDKAEAEGYEIIPGGEEKKPEEDSEEGAKPDGEEDGEEGGEEDAETDEDVLRGRELLEAESAEKGDEKGPDGEKIENFPEEFPPKQVDEYSPFTARYNPEDVEFFKEVLPKDMFPKGEFELKDGTKLDFEYFFNENPEAPVAMAMIANNIIQQMIANNHLITGDSLNETGRSIDQKLFIRTLTNKNDGVPNALDIYKSDDFKVWFEKEPGEVKALIEKSNDPYDHIRVFKRFLNKEGLKKAKDKVVEIDKKRKEKKKTFDSVHKTTVRGKKTHTPTTSDDIDAEKAAFYEDDDDDPIY